MILPPRRLLMLAIGMAGSLFVPDLTALSAQTTATRLAVSADQSVGLGLRFAKVEAATAGSLSLPGQVVVPAARQMLVAAPLAGRLDRIELAVGDRVQGGQVLALLTAGQLAERQREWQQARVQRDLARDSLDRDERLVAEGLIPQSRVRAAHARLAEAEALLAERRAQLALSGLPAPEGATASSTSQIALRAPVSGVLLEVGAANGQRVEAAAPLFRIAHGNERWLELKATPDAAARVRIGDEVQWPERGVSARVSAIGEAVNAGQTVTIRAQPRSGADRIRPGELLQAQLRLSDADRARWSVPSAAVTTWRGRTVVFCATEGGVRIVDASVRDRQDERVLVDADLRAGDRVAVAGVSALKALASEARP